MHYFWLLVALFIEKAQLISSQYHLMLSVLLFRRLQVACAGILLDLLIRVNVFEASEALQHDLELILLLWRAIPYLCCVNL